MKAILPKTKLISIGSKLLAGMTISIGAYVNCKVGGPLGAVLFCIGLIVVISLVSGCTLVGYESLKESLTNFFTLLLSCYSILLVAL